MNIAIIPARFGSKRIKQKNIKKFLGKPIIFWSINAALKAKIFDKIIVSTDSKKIANIARKYKADVPFLRSKKLSGDHVGTAEVIIDAIKKIEKKNIIPKFVCCIYPASPLIKSTDIVEAFKIIKKKNWNFVFSATKYENPVRRGFEIGSKGETKMLFPKEYTKRSQDLKSVYFDAAQFYWGKKNAWFEKKPLFNKKSTIIEIPKVRSCDIDTYEDWQNALNIAKGIKLKA
tara:strand:+ start:3325 stop:4017 length:693 start_codon:yes stop_codon:yes gene_type:complete